MYLLSCIISKRYTHDLVIFDCVNTHLTPSSNSTCQLGQLFPNISVLYLFIRLHERISHEGR